LPRRGDLLVWKARSRERGSTVWNPPGGCQTIREKGRWLALRGVGGEEVGGLAGLQRVCMRSSRWEQTAGERKVPWEGLFTWRATSFAGEKKKEFGKGEFRAGVLTLVGKGGHRRRAGSTRGERTLEGSVRKDIIRSSSGKNLLIVWGGKLGGGSRDREFVKGELPEFLPFASTGCGEMSGGGKAVWGATGRTRCKGEKKVVDTS